MKSSTAWSEKFQLLNGGSSAWPNLEVTTFFTQCNWQGLPIARSQPPIATVQPSAPASGMSLSAPQPIANWQALSVDQFFEQNNWAGRVRAVPVVTEQPRSLAVAADWPTLPVAAFFEQVNWSGQQQRVYSQAESAPALSFTMPVAEFFGLIAWEAKPAIAALPDLPAPVAPSREISLSDLSDLF
ncbi:MAG: hypothetical protein KME35_10485 [Aphanocapsa sp. GSE-SYN-MK-11-07L]|jgi:hypothetical protein|nr:hypothetical protein [Aphanocapsa sp. GSE-SYN-MK-11-07L]